MGTTNDRLIVRNSYCRVEKCSTFSEIVGANPVPPISLKSCGESVNFEHLLSTVAEVANFFNVECHCSTQYIDFFSNFVSLMRLNWN